MGVPEEIQEFGKFRENGAEELPEQKGERDPRDMMIFSDDVKCAKCQ